MNRPNVAKLGLIGLAYGSIMLVSAADAPRDTVGVEAKAAAKEAGKAAKALDRHDAAAAIAAAEGAVALQPRVADYRMLLGQGYLQAGRFTSAGQAFADTLALGGPVTGRGKAALNLALAQIATGDWQAARATLATHAGDIPAGDRGLAMALAGDTAGAVQVLTGAARSAEASPKVRQNLALAYALAGQWGVARMVAATDMSPADVDARIEQWAAFAQPQSASDQVASLLGVRAVTDTGEPTRLALNPVSGGTALAAAPVATAQPTAAPQPLQVAAAAPVRAGVTFGPRREVVQALPATLIAREAGPFKVAARAATSGGRAVGARFSASAGGTWYVQLGAYDNAGVARDAWGRAQRRFAGWGGRTPNGMTFRTGQASFYRLSVGGFSRASAVTACRQYRAHGGDCFVRAGAGDQMAAWVKPGVQVASR